MEWRETTLSSSSDEEEEESGNSFEAEGVSVSARVWSRRLNLRRPLGGGLPEKLGDENRSSFSSICGRITNSDSEILDC